MDEDRIAGTSGMEKAAGKTPGSAQDAVRSATNPVHTAVPA